MSSPTPTSPLQSPSMLSSPPHVSTLTLDVNVKETREANVTGAMLNGQFVLGKVLGRGSFGTVHEATDIVANRTVAIKEMDAKKLRRTKALASFKPGNGTGGMPMRGGGVFRGAVGRRPPPGSTPPITTPPIVQDTPKQDPIDLVRGEIAIMKKLQHPNIVRLYEVLHDPSQEIIYMVYELMEKGVIMDIGLDTTAEPFPEEKARFYFRQIILAIEYLHEHDIAHRAITTHQPDNLLVSKDNILKVVDFGVSEIFGTQGNDKSNKSEGSPAFFSPELCMPNHGNISARAVDVWAIGVCVGEFVAAKAVFVKHQCRSLCIACPDLSSPTMSPELADLLSHLLDKNPTTRITVDKIRNHPWLTVNGKEPLLPSKSENCRKMVTEITSEDMAAAVSTFNPVWTVMRAVQKFKTRLTPTGSRAGSKDELAGSVSSSSQLAGSLTTSQRSLSRESFVGQASSLVGSLLSLSGMSRSVSTGNGMEGSSASSGGIKTAPGETVGDVMDIDKTIDSLATSKSTAQ
ncbi:kinase-like domain-containing protein [Chytriomyces cf. hyalinus JEL632]|nr:kinase-like domain-containing protein [Chytriomyces cf. hyalinus JEL632]